MANRIVEFIKTKEVLDGEELYTVKVNNKLLHSAYYPFREAEKYVEKLDIGKGQKPIKIVFYGLGLGYHIKALLDRYGESVEITVFELSKDIYAHKAIGQYRVLSELSTKNNVNLIISDYDNDFCQLFSKALESCEAFHIYKPSMDIIPEKAKAFADVLLEYKAEKDTEINNKELLEYNGDNNKLLKDCKTMLQFFEEYSLNGRDVIIIAGGPSLNTCLDKLKVLSDTGKFFVITMGTPLKMLLENGIKVDMFCSTDPLVHVNNQIASLDTKKLNIPMCFLYTSSFMAAQNYKGPKYIFYNYDKINDMRIDCGNSVATAALSIAIAGKPKSIALVGQDLAYIGGKRHVDNTVYGKEHYYKVNDNDFLAEAVDGSDIYTNKFFYSVKQWMERAISVSDEINFINCSKGLNIKGCKNIDIDKLEDVLNG